MNKEILYVGCYTPEGNAGIKVVEFNNLNGELTEIDAISVLSDSSFLAVSDNKKYLLAVSEHETDGELGCFDLTDPLKPIFINKQSTLGGSPCHISLSAQKAFVSNYGTGNVSAFSLTQAQLMPAYTQVQHHGQGGNLDRQASAHAHASQLSRNEKFLVVADLGIDALQVYGINDDALTFITKQSVKPGSGPRHLAFNKNGDKLYLGNELSSDVIVYDFNQESGALTEGQQITSLPSNFDGESYIAEVTISKDGDYLYVSNRGHDSIAIYSIDAQTGLLTALEHVKTGGLFPRHFSLSPDQNWLLVAHQNSEHLHVFKRHPETGLLTKTEHSLPVQHAVCLCFY